jgi:CHAT domain-containing protein/tetratricopeptide (TPR) repeat protein
MRSVCVGAKRRQATEQEAARALKAAYDEEKARDPLRAARTAAQLQTLAQASSDPIVAALAAWTSGMAALQDGRTESALVLLDAAVVRFEELGDTHSAAATHVSTLHALALLGRYDEAFACGQQARDVFVAEGDLLAAGKIEQNLGNLCLRRDRYPQAEELYRAARKRFVAVDDPSQLAQIENLLGWALAAQHEFRGAARFYEQALQRAEAGGLTVLQAMTEQNLGCLALFQGRYDRALAYLERARRRFGDLAMSPDLANVEQDMAEAYMELNLAPEAARIAARVAATAAELQMRAERARALLCHGRASLQLGHADEGRRLLAEARTLYAAEGNSVGAALATLVEAQVLCAEGDYHAASTAAQEAEAPFAAAGAWGHLLRSRWVLGEAARGLDQRAAARALLETTLRQAEEHSVVQAAYRCHTSLGLLAAAEGNVRAAESSFQRAVALIEDLREPLPAEEFRTAFFSDKLTPYAELARLALRSNGPLRGAEALGYVERARSRSLLDMIDGAVDARWKPRDGFEAELSVRVDRLREELNWFYSRINRAAAGEGARDPQTMAGLYAAVQERETAVADIDRQVQQRSGTRPGRPEPVDVSELQRALGADTVLVEYFSLDGLLMAFVVTQDGVQVVQDLAREDQVEAAVEQLRFQVDALRYGSAQLGGYVGQLADRARQHLATLYDLVLRPIQPLLGDGRRLVVVPHRALHYVPFHALHDGRHYVIEQREVSYAPSGEVLRHCLNRPRRPLRRALLVGVADAQTLRVLDEVAAIAPLFAESVTLLDGATTLAAIREQVALADVLHLACHGQFRPDNPSFSSLRLAESWLTMRDAYSLDLRCDLVTLSACETGRSTVAPGDELMGLARGFFSTGVPSMAMLMARFYERLCGGDTPAAALRCAQRELLQHHAHPFYWAPFMVLGRW